jgi:hypothetical protein
MRETQAHGLETQRQDTRAAILSKTMVAPCFQQSIRNSKQHPSQQRSKSQQKTLALSKTSECLPV